MKKSNRRKLHITAIVIFIFFVCSLVGYSRGLKLTIQQETIEKVNLVAAQNKENVSRKLTFSMQQIRGTKNQIMDAYYSDNGFDKEGLIACLKSIEDRQNFINMGIVLKDGTLYSSQDLNVDMYHSDYIQKTFNDGQIHISDTFINRVNQKLTIVLSDAIIQNNEVIGVVYIAYAIEDFRDVLSVSSFDGTGYSYIIKEDGTAIMDSTHEGSFVDFQNLYTSLKNASPKNEDCIAQLKAELGKKAQGHFIFHNKIDKYCAYTSLGINDWYLLTVVPRSYVDGTSDRVVFYTALLYVVLIILFGFLSFLTYHFMRDKNKELEKMLFEDKVTHMISYEKFMIDEQEFIESLKADEKAAYMYLDIENFKLINDLYGFEYGDQALQYIAYILSDKLKNIGIFARMYADHFIVLISYKNKTELLDYVNAIHTAIRNGYKSNTSYILKPTLGIYEIAADNKEDFEFMHNCAKIAHTSIKKQKDKMYAIYTDDMRIKLLKNKSLEDSIIKGIDMDEFIVYYQPKYDTITKKIVGSEALIRWQTADERIISPGVFIPAAETSGLISDLDELVFRKVCEHLRYSLDNGLKVVPVSVNVSKKTLYDKYFIERYRSYIHLYNIPYELVELEITESLLTLDKNRTIRIIEELHEYGIHVLMDDFGTGYSSVMMLKDFDIDILKLDKTFIDDYEDKKGSQILKTIIELAHSLGMNIVAEGVETKLQYEFLRSLNCEVIQGFYFSRPVDEEVYDELLKSQK